MRASDGSSHSDASPIVGSKGAAVRDMPEEHRAGKGHPRHRPTPADRPADPRPGEAMDHEEPRGDDRQRHMQPVDELAAARAAHADRHASDLDLHEENAGREQADRRREEPVPDLRRVAVGQSPGLRKMQQAEGDRRHDQQEPEQQMDEDVPEIDLVLQRCPGPPLEKGHRGEGEAVDDEQREEPQDHPQQPAKPRRDRLDRLRHRAIDRSASGMG